MSKSYTLMELEAIKHLCKCVNSVASLPTDLIADTNVATNTTYSSYKIDAEMIALENDIQRYVDTALAGLNKLSKEVIDDKALVVKENVLYLYKDPLGTSNDYMQMMLINGVVVELGSTTCDMSGYYTNTEIDDKFALKIDLDVLTTSFNNFATAIDEKVDKTEMKEITEQDILSKLGLSTTDIETMNKILDDAVVTTTKTFSSSKIYADIQQCLQDSKDFTLREIANKVGASYKIVTDVVDMTSKDHLYLMNNGGVYDIYIVDDTNAPVKIGDTNVDLSGYVKVTDLENDYLKKVDADGKYATIVTVDGKVDKTDIVDNLTSIDTDKPLSANQGKVLKDELGLKANDSEVVKKTDIATTIDLSSTNDKVPSASAIYYKSKNKITEVGDGEDIIAYADSISNETVMDMVRIMNGINSPYGADTYNDFYYTIYNITDNNFKRIVAYDIRRNDMYMIMKIQGVWGKWQRVCATSIADVSKTLITFPNETNHKIVTPTETYYIVKNGICFVHLVFKTATADTTTQVQNLPIPLANASIYAQVTQYDYKNISNVGARVSLFNTGILDITGGNVGTVYTCSFSYPVAE